MTEHETRRPFPCDDLVDAPALETWRAVDVAAPVEVMMATTRIADVWSLGDLVARCQLLDLKRLAESRQAPGIPRR